VSPFRHLQPIQGPVKGRVLRRSPAGVVNGENSPILADPGRYVPVGGKGGNLVSGARNNVMKGLATYWKKTTGAATK